MYASDIKKKKQVIETEEARRELKWILLSERDQCERPVVYDCSSTISWKRSSNADSKNISGFQGLEEEGMSGWGPPFHVMLDGQMCGHAGAQAQAMHTTVNGLVKYEL
jgi:hypothetical protein